MAQGDKAAGAALTAAAAGTVLAMAHHPTSAHAAGLASLVHAAMILLFASMSFGFAHVARRRGLARPAVLAGLVAWGIGALGHVAAATVNGFAVPALAARGHIGHDILLLAWELNQAFAALGVWGTSAAYLLWGADWLRDRGAAAKALGAAGVAAGAVPALLLAAGAIELDVGGAFIIYAIEAAWAILLGLHLLRGAAPESAAPST